MGPFLPDRRLLRPGALARLLPLALLALVGGALLMLAGDPATIIEWVAANADRLRTEAARWGIAAVLAYVAAYAALMATLWVPAWPCSIVGGVLFGLWPGTFYALFGATIGAAAAYLLVRLGVSGLTRPSGQVMRRFEAGLSADGFWFLVLVRLVPIFPFAAINIVAAVLAVPPWAFIVSTLLGIVPSTLVYVSLGQAIEVGVGTAAWTRPEVLLPLGGLAGLGLLAILGRHLAGNRSG
jgi:uncharacterized membrane protein YdjX (TVP38/TMEM64 family)